MGLIEALIAAFIFIGEQKGGFMAFVYLLVYGAVNFTASDFAGLPNKTFAQRERIVTWVAYLGASLLFASRCYLKA